MSQIHSPGAQVCNTLKDWPTAIADADDILRSDLRARSPLPPKIELPTGPAVSTLSRASGMETGPSNIADLSTPFLGTNDRIPDQSLNLKVPEISPPILFGLDWTGYRIKSSKTEGTGNIFRTETRKT